MNKLLLFGAIMSFIYFVIIAAYTGMGSSFGYIWLVGAVVLLLLFFLRQLSGMYTLALHEKDANYGMHSGDSFSPHQEGNVLGGDADYGESSGDIRWEQEGGLRQDGFFGAKRAGLWRALGTVFGRKLPLWLRVGAKTTILLAGCLFIFIEVLIVRDMFLPYPEDLDYVIVLGARVEGERVSKSLRLRLDKALEYAETNPAVVVVASGGQGAGEAISEARAMEQYLTARGFPPGQIIKEPHSRNTRENLHNSFSYIVVDWCGRDGWQEGINPKIGVISNNFHIFRARAIAKKQGFTTISGVPAPSDPILLLNQMCREFFALVKDWLVGNL